MVRGSDSTVFSSTLLGFILYSLSYPLEASGFSKWALVKLATKIGHIYSKELRVSSLDTPTPLEKETE